MVASFRIRRSAPFKTGSKLRSRLAGLQDEDERTAVVFPMYTEAEDPG